MDRGRFSLLQLDPGEIYFEDFSVIFVPSDTTRKTYDSKTQEGRLKMCSKSLVFDPNDISKPMLKISLKECVIIEEWKGSSKFIQSDNVLSINAKEYIEMFESNHIVPYVYKGANNFLFILKYAVISNILPPICQLHRASTLPAAEQIDMIATIVHSRQSRVSFDHLWLDLYEKVILETQADKVTPLVVNPGRVLLSTTRIYFQPYNNVDAYPVIKIDLNSIQRIVKRRFLLRHIGMEIYSNENSLVPHIYFSFSTKNERDQFYQKIMEQPELKLNEITPSVMTLQWQNGIISNFEYLMWINSLGDRTINDLTQYPVFPWVISNYTSDKLDLDDLTNFRDLSKPVGALNPSRLEKLLERYNEMAAPKFLYGSHYSTPGFVLFYLARQYPHYVLCLQSGRFDHPDRMFNSMKDVYKNCLNNMSDFKELIPEFYDTTQGGKFLVNEMRINFGYRCNGIKVDDVELPPWTANEKDFVRKLRDALESDYVSENLHNWIDLIFGYKQKGEEAQKAYNVFYSLCYEGNVNLETIVDLNERHALEVQIMEFGQIPKQVFDVPHPKKKSKRHLLLKEPSDIKIELSNEEKWKQHSMQLDQIACFSTHKSVVSSIFVSKNGKDLISVGHDSKLKIFSIDLKRQIRSANVGNMPLSSCIQLPNSNIFVVGSWDNQIFLYDLDYGKVMESIFAHEDAVKCMSWSERSNILVSGSGDCTIKIWKGFSSEEVIKPIQCLFRDIDFNGPVNCLDFNGENSYLAVGTADGDVTILETTNFAIFKKYQSECNVECISFSPDGTKLALGGQPNLFRIVDTSTGMTVFEKTLCSSVVSMRWNDYLLILGCDNGDLIVWDTVEVKILYEIQGAHKGKITSVDVAMDNSFLCSAGEDGLIKVWKPL